MTYSFTISGKGLKSAHSISRCLRVRGQLHGMHSGGGSPFSENL